MNKERETVPVVQANTGAYPWWLCPVCDTKNVVVANPRAVDECLGCGVTVAVSYPQSIIAMA